MRHLEEMMPPEKTTGKITRQPDPAASEPAEAMPQTDTTAPEYDRLLSKGQGIIDAFETLGLLVIRLIDKERESVEQANPAPSAPPNRSVRPMRPPSATTPAASSL
jgi:hypothetical protein